MSAEAAAVIREFLTRRFPDTAIEDSDDIFALGLATSLFTMELVRFVERTFRCDVPDDEMQMSNFRSIEAMSLLVARMKATSPAG